MHGRWRIDRASHADGQAPRPVKTHRAGRMRSMPADYPTALRPTQRYSVDVLLMIMTQESVVVGVDNTV